MEAYALETSGGPFRGSRDRFESVVSWLDGEEAADLTHAELEAHAIVRPRQIRECPCVPAMDTPRWRGTQWTGHVGLRRAHQEGDLRRGVVDMTGSEA